MSVHVQGDVHLEHGGNVDRRQLSHDDILILPGDLCPFVLERLWVPWLQRIAAIVKEVVWVPGNHEYYGCKDMDEAIATARQNLPENVRIRDLETFTLTNGQTAAACTLWGYEPNTDLSGNMRDFTSIGGLTPDLCNELHLIHREFILDAKVDVIITHHAPLKRGISSPLYEGNACANYYGTNTIQRHPSPPMWWYFGHTHWNVVKKIGRTTVVSAFEKLISLH